jgi:hypothetical protein
LLASTRISSTPPMRCLSGADCIRQKGSRFGNRRSRRERSMHSGRLLASLPT